MKRTAPTPLDIRWKCKPVETARSGVEILADGRIHCWIEHEVIQGVTPKMLVWWFGHLEGDMLHDGEWHARYRVWHPRDHVAIRYVRRNFDRSVGVGSIIHLTEMLGANPDYLIDTHTEIVRLDEGGFAHRPRFHGLRLAAMDYEFSESPEGTIYHNSLTIGARGLLGRLINPLLRRFVFDEKRGHAWIRHNIEEVGNFETFLPALYASETGTRSTRAGKPAVT
jgi:hypothetical protein